ncbi:hypothetical protein C6376_24310 [Streptomyces sp. P3]|nr:hypothetical protein C6376_24310 [Streptomyces sp. P3]
MVEDHGRGQPEAGRGVEAVAQFYGGQRVEADVLERAVGAYGLRRLVSQNGRGVPAHRVEQGVFGLLRREPGEPGAGVPRVTGFDGGGTARDSADETAQQGGHPAGTPSQGGVVEERGHEGGPSPVDGGVQERESLIGVERPDAVAGDADAVGGAQVRGQTAGLPQAPGHRGGGQSE